MPPLDPGMKRWEVALARTVHTLFYVLIARYEANLIAPLTLITPLATIALGVVITNDQLDTQMIVGSAIALTGVLIVALRRTRAPIAEAQEHS